jgi:GNAT superfamily N-acetyltransferase
VLQDGSWAVPWVVRDVIRDINKAVGKRWQELDPLLPQPVDLPAGCAEPLQATGRNGRLTGYAVCRHQYWPAESLSQTWGTATRYVLSPRLRDRDTMPALDDLLGQWRDHLAQIPEARSEDTSALISWPTRDVSGVRALLRHGFQPMSVLAARPKGRPVPLTGHADVIIRKAGPADLDAVAEMEMGVIRYDAQFGGAIERPATQSLVRADAGAALAKQKTWTWLAERDGRPAGLVVVSPPADSSWVAIMTSQVPAAYLGTMFVKPEERETGVATSLVQAAHRELDALGISVTLLHYAQVNPVSGPFWNRMGYRPLWTSWESRPAAR